MTETTKALRSKQGGNNDVSQATNIAERRSASRSWVLGLLCAGLIGEVPSKAEAEPAGSPTANDIFYNCTFTTADLNAALTVSQANLDLLASGQIEASYIIIYARENANDGQLRTGTTPSFTGPVLCTNVDTADITPTDEGTAIAGPVDVLGAEEVSHLQVRSSTSTDPDDTRKRVCHTVASKTQCFLIEIKPPLE
jgi:hypothetical protein